MKKLITLSLFTILAFQLSAQKDWLKDIDHGLVLKINSNRYSDYTFSKGNSYEGGMHFLLNFTKRKKISAELRAGYSEASLSYNQLLGWQQSFFFSDTIVRKSRTGDIEYENIHFSIPIKFRYKFNKKNSGFHLTGGMIHNFKIWKKMNWKFDEYIYENDNWPDPSTYTLFEENQEENLDLNAYHFEVIGGIGYKRKKVMVEFLISGGDVYVNDDYIRRLVKLTNSFVIYYQLN